MAAAMLGELAGCSARKCVKVLGTRYSGNLWANLVSSGRPPNLSAKRPNQRDGCLFSVLATKYRPSRARQLS